jgi:hypothetical protein
MALFKELNQFSAMFAFDLKNCIRSPLMGVISGFLNRLSYHVKREDPASLFSQDVAKFLN